MILKLFGLLIISPAIMSEYHEKTDKLVDYFAPAKYTYSYGVEDFKTGDYKMHKEERNGDVVKGEYRIADPDGSIRTVTYTADKEHGFQAIVKQSKTFSDSHKLNANDETQNVHGQNQDSSSQYEPHSYGSPVQSNNHDFNEQSIFKYTPSVNNLHKFTENSNHVKEDKQEKQEANQYVYHDSPRNLKIQSNQQEHNQYNIIPKKKQQQSNNFSMKQVDVAKELAKNQNSNYQLSHLKSKPVKPIDGPKMTQNVEATFHVGQHNYKPSVTEELQYAPPHIEIPKVEINGKFYKNNMNAEQNFATQSYYIPVQHQGNNQNNFKHNTFKPSTILRENYLDSKQTPKLVHAENANQDFQELFYQPHYFNIQYEDILRQVENNEQIIPYQSVKTPKATQGSVKGQHYSEPSIGSQSKPQQQKGNQKPAVSYQSVTNGKKSPVGKTEDYDKYFQAENNEGMLSTKGNQMRPLYIQHLDNTRTQRNMKTENNRMVKSTMQSSPSKKQFKYPEYVNKQYKMLSDYIQPSDLKMYSMPNYESYVFDDASKSIHQIQGYPTFQFEKKEKL